jgi:hypothetical protein
MREVTQDEMEFDIFCTGERTAPIAELIKFDDEETAAYIIIPAKSAQMQRITLNFLLEKNSFIDVLL